VIEKVPREKGYLYFIGKDGYIWRAPMKHNETGTKARVGTVKVDRKEYEKWNNPKHKWDFPPAPAPTPQIGFWRLMYEIAYFCIKKR